jgi:hypothetical protein
MEDDVQQVNDVHEVIEREPDEQGVHGDLGEAEPKDDHPEVVEEGQGDDHGPVVAEPSGRVENERPVASGTNVIAVTF